MILLGFVGTVYAQEFYESPNLIAIIELDNSKPYFEHGDTLAVKGYVMENHGLTKVGNSTMIFFLEWPNTTKTILYETKTNQSGDFSLMIPISSEFGEGRYIISAEPSGLGYQAQLENDRKTLEIFVGKSERLVTPLKQVKSGIPFDEIQCKNGLQLEQKYDGRPACLKPESIPKLVERGWIKDSSTKQKSILTLDEFRKTLAETSNLESLIQKFGKPHDDIGSGIHIYVYNLFDGTQIWIGYTDKILYLRHMDSNGALIEDVDFRQNTKSGFEEFCDPGPILNDGYCHKNGLKVDLGSTQDHIVKNAVTYPTMEKWLDKKTYTVFCCFYQEFNEVRRVQVHFYIDGTEEHYSADYDLGEKRIVNTTDYTPLKEQ